MATPAAGLYYPMASAGGRKFMVGPPGGVRRGGAQAQQGRTTRADRTPNRTTLGSGLEDEETAAKTSFFKLPLPQQDQAFERDASPAAVAVRATTTAARESSSDAANKAARPGTPPIIEKDNNYSVCASPVPSIGGGASSDTGGGGGRRLRRGSSSARSAVAGALQNTPRGGAEDVSSVPWDLSLRQQPVRPMAVTRRASAPALPAAAAGGISDCQARPGSPLLLDSSAGSPPPPGDQPVLGRRGSGAANRALKRSVSLSAAEEDPSKLENGSSQGDVSLCVRLRPGRGDHVATADGQGSIRLLAGGEACATGAGSDASSSIPFAMVKYGRDGPAQYPATAPSVRRRTRRMSSRMPWYPSSREF